MTNQSEIFILGACIGGLSLTGLWLLYKLWQADKQIVTLESECIDLLEKNAKLISLNKGTIAETLTEAFLEKE